MHQCRKGEKTAKNTKKKVLDEKPRHFSQINKQNDQQLLIVHKSPKNNHDRQDKTSIY